MRADLLQVVEAAYDLDATPSRWMQGVTNTVGPLIDGGYGAYGTIIDASVPKHMHMGNVACYRGDPVFIQAIFTTAAGLSGGDVKDVYWGTSAIHTATERVGTVRWDELARPNGPSAIRDCTAVVAANAKGVGCMVLAPLDHAHRHSQRTKRVWARVVAMQRLRRSLAGAALRVREEGEAALSPEGEVAHASGPARSKSARALLRAAAVDRECARGRLRRRPEEAVELWRALVAGRWSIVDRFDRDGRRFLIAHENEPEAAALRALTARERQVASFVAMGHSNKLVAYELGLSVGSVGAYLASAMRKLGLDSRLDLARLVASEHSA